MLRGLLLVLGLCLLVGCGGTPTATTVPATAPTPVPVVVPTDTTAPAPPTEPPAPTAVPATETPAAPAETPIVLSGSGILKTPPFTLSGGAYVMDWTAKATNPTVGCYHSGLLSPVDPKVFMMEMLGNEMVKDVANGSTNVYNVKAGQYYLNMSSGCEWTVTIHR